MPASRQAVQAAHPKASLRAARPSADVAVPLSTPAAPGIVRRASACACGGGCPRCTAAHDSVDSADHAENEDSVASSSGSTGSTSANSTDNSNNSNSAEPAADEASSAAAWRRASGIHPRLQVGSPDDPLEREADALADRVVAMPGAAGLDGPLDSTPSSAQGRPLDGTLRAWFEPRFGRSFEQVRIHTGDDAAARSEALHARAWTLGPDIWFNHGQYDPKSAPGRHLLAHELAHVAQAGGAGPIRRAPLDFDVNDLPNDAPGDTGQIYF
ncbi:MAG: DUF4157 domain-containing protein, partial [Caldimonas sp.]